jgi:peptidoglycan/xylan/chitin deacetylase (PgdA/CDA1 family)
MKSLLPIHVTPYVQVRRSWVADYEVGVRQSELETARMRRLKPLLAPWSSLICVDTDDRVLSLTFDDGPDPQLTPFVLDALAAAGARATFFMLSSAARQHPELARRVALHGVTHERSTELPRAQAAARLRQGKAELEDVVQQQIRLYRPTYGAIRMSLIVQARQLGLETIIWSAWARDWLGDPPEEVAQRAFTARHPGAVVLLHDTVGGVAEPPLSSPESVRQLLELLRPEGWQCLTTGELLARYPHVRCHWFLRPGASRSQGEAPEMG